MLFFFFFLFLEDNVWFEHFRQQLISMRNEYLALSAQCLEGGETATIDYILNRHVIFGRKIIIVRRLLLFSVLFFVRRIQ